MLIELKLPWMRHWQTGITSGILNAFTGQGWLQPQKVEASSMQKLERVPPRLSLEGTSLSPQTCVAPFTQMVCGSLLLLPSAAAASPDPDQRPS